MKLRHLVLAMSLAVPGVALSAQCDPDLMKADAGVAAGPKPTVTAEAFAEAQGFITEARAMLAAGDDIGCVFTVGRALELLDLSEGD